MRDLFAQHVPRRRSFAGTGLSVGLHIALAVGLILLARLSSAIPRVPASPSLTFIVFPTPRAVELRMPPTPLRVPRPSFVQLRAPAPAVPIVKKPERLEARANVEP